MQRFHVSAIELFIATNSPDHSLLLSWVHSVTSIKFRQIINFYTSSILHMFASLTRKERCNRFL